MSNESKLLERVEAHAQQTLRQVPTAFLYHNLKHTQQVVKAASELADNLNLNSQDKEKLLIAAWFHDIAYSTSNDNHEEAGAAIAAKYLNEQGYDAASIAEVESLIRVTKLDAIPNTLLEKVMRDADCAHLGQKKFQRRTDLLRMEWEGTQNKVFTEQEWLQNNIDFLKNHQYFTAIAKTEWGATKQKHIAELEKQLGDVGLSTNITKTAEEIKRSRGVETMFRVTLRNHINLSRIADNKANFLLSISGIIISLLLGELISDNNPVQSMLYPTVYFLVVCIITMVLAILAARPNVTKGEFTKEGLLNKKTNILFFGNFHKMPLDDFTWGMNEYMKNDELLYDALIKDLYFLGLVMNKKYKLLRYAFNFFMFGIISSAIFYGIMVLNA